MVRIKIDTPMYNPTRESAICCGGWAEGRGKGEGGGFIDHKPFTKELDLQAPLGWGG